MLLFRSTTGLVGPMASTFVGRYNKFIQSHALIILQHKHF